ncbi:MAG: bifunctional homocysteine S-methyltransferase/methylenetetrahydrofolate reductase [Alicyclobacillus sp.]|nr:bifunctional homocysteine S-methyltransferase/methylenetetrahydrofolate reductase [Alicyclobacillus sp.]
MASSEKPVGSLLERARKGVVVGDGAMATLLHQTGVPIRTCFEELCVTHPEWVERVHRAYVEAGADWVQTNTFSGNRLGLERYGLGHQVTAINRAAARVARTAANGRALVLGTIGSTVDVRRPYDVELGADDWARVFAEQAEALLAEGVDGLLLETFPLLSELLVALRVVRAMTTLPVLAHLSPDAVGVTRDGVPLAEAFARLTAAGADVVGLNCRLGPAGVLRSYEGLVLTPGHVYSAAPNAGTLYWVEGDYAYSGGPDYFAETGVELAKRGVRILAGCCGTTPAHIRRLRERLSQLVLPTLPQLGREAAESQPACLGASLVPGRGTDDPGEAAAPGDRRLEVIGNYALQQVDGADKRLDVPWPPAGSLADRARHQRTVVVELDPPRTLDITRFLQGAVALQQAGAHAITLADNSLGTVRVSNMALAALLKQMGIEPLVHVACRDRNLIGQQSHLMGLHVLGIHHLLLVTGDPSRFGDLPGATSVYDVSSTQLARLVRQLNQGIAFSGQPLRQPARFVVGTAFNPNVLHFDKAIDRLRRKLDAGADYVMTQPLFDPRMFDRIARAAEEFHAPVFVGIMPLTSARNARFLHNEVPGIRIPEDILERMLQASPEQANEEGLRIAEELLDEALACFRGVYLVTPFLRYDLTVHLTRYALRTPAQAAAGGQTG